MEVDIPKILPSLTEPNTLFLFRENGAEIKIKLFGRGYSSSHRLKKEEKQFLENEILKEHENTYL